MNIRSAMTGSLSSSAPRRGRILPLLLLMAVCATPESGRGQSVQADTVILIDGSIRTGRLERCSGSLCVLGGAQIPRSTILFIGLRAAMPPPPPSSPMRDEVHRIDKSIHPGPLVSVDATSVVAASTHPRKQVAWIYLSPVATSGDLIGDGSGDQAESGVACDRNEVFFYDVLVKGEKSGRETMLPQYKTEGEFAFSYAYTARYPRVPVTVKCEEDGSTKISGPADFNQQHSGTATLTSYIWRDSQVSRPSHPDLSNQVAVPCGFNVSTAALGAEIRFDGFVPDRAGERPFLAVTSRLRKADHEALDALLAARRDAVCDKGWLTNVRVFDGLAATSETGPFYGRPVQVAGGSLHPPSLSFYGNFHINPDSVGDPEPLHALLRGESFTVSSGQRTFEGRGSQSDFRATWSVTVTLTRAR